ncbi:M23 family metallopeptidase [Gordonia sinesedis]
MDDLTGRGLAGGATATVSPGRRRAVVDDATAAEATTVLSPIGAPTDDLDSEFEALRSGSRRFRRDRPSTAEITQDILIPEGEFDEYRHERPFDVDGARPDHFSRRAATDSVGSGELELDGVDTDDEHDTPFRRNPANARTRSRGKHRISAPPTALRGGRAALVAMAAGAAVAAASQAGTSDEVTVTPTAAKTDPAPAPTPAAAPVPDIGPGVASGTANQDLSTFTNQLAQGKALADAETARKIQASKPLFESPLPLGTYQFTSLYANRWGAFHGGLDLAAPLGTPIRAAADGVVIEAGPASGYGNWIQVKLADGTVNMYGHMAASGVLVQKGQRVTAGDVIALVGNEGFSTGPHCHFEVWKNGTTKIDPAPWLAERGVRLANYGG